MKSTIRLSRKHLQGGIRKGAIDEATAETKFQAWVDIKIASEKAIVEKLAADKDALAKNKHAGETKIKEARAQAILKKNAPVVEEVAAPEVSAEAETTEEPAAE